MKHFMFPMLFLLQSVNFIQTQDEGCPVLDNKCQCILNHPQYGDTINCVAQDFTDVPAFEASNRTWDTLLLSYNLLVEIPDGCFANLNVKNLYLDKNDISIIGQNAFSDLANSLELIHLGENRIISPMLSSIHDLPYLNSINLRSNLITELTNEYFLGLPSLTNLNCEYNQLVRLSRSYTENIPTLTRLDVSANSISTVDDDALHHLTALVELDFGINNLPQIPTPAFDGLSKLEYLSFWANDITEIGEDDLATLSSTVTTLTLGQNPVSALPENLFRTVPNLQYLNLDIMYLNSVPEMIFENLTALYSLSIYDNLFSEVPKALSSLSELNTFFANDNSISRIEGTEFIDNPSLFYLELSRNSIAFVNESLFCQNQNLRQIYLPDNDIVNFGACAPLTVSGLNIGLNGNPIDCGCDILWLKQHDHLLNTGSTICATPPSLAGRPISEIDDEEFQCDLDMGEECANACY